MRAVQFLGDRQAIVRDKKDPRPGLGEVLLRIRASAICGSDLHRYRPARGDRPLDEGVPGHEPCGEVVEIGAGVDGLSVGDRVLLYHRVGCGTCVQCRTGNSNICQHGQRSYGGHLDGADAQMMVALAHRCFKLPDDLSWDDAVVISCQAGTAYAPLRRLGASGRDQLVVTGLGPVGLCVLLLGHAMGARIIGVDPMAERRAIATQLGADETLDASDSNLGQMVRDLTNGGADALVETSGSRAAHAKIAELLRVNGQAAIVGLGSHEPSINPIAFFGKQITLFASNLYPEWLLPEIFAFVHRQQVPLAQIITHRVSIEDAPAMFRLADSATAGKIVFRFG
ncbi:MAG TPA: alcohol dehydrogenase catalytic domain-containing protein [Chloroflexota bacterium]|nr:alcohol dehydrogenase catalytic domain-containing protein [Chloroflexota bacterium]